MEDRKSQTDNPCLSCGACCATFRVSFYWSEADSLGLPETLTERINPFMKCMKGTDSATPRCALLAGTIGKKTACTAYEMRPSPCRELLPGDDKCNRARLRHGMEEIG